MSKSAAVEAIIRECTAARGLSANAVRRQDRRAPVVAVRHVAMALMRELLELKLIDIAALCGERDHTGVLHALRKVEAAEIGAGVVRGSAALAAFMAQMRTVCAGDPDVVAYRAVHALAEAEAAS